MGTVLSLFAECPLPLCRNPVGDPGELCGACEKATAGYIRRVPAPEPLGDVEPEAAPVREPRLVQLVEARDKRMTAIERASRQDLGEEHKPGQLCWVCEERRLCRKDPEFLGTRDERWICKECEAIPA